MTILVAAFPNLGAGGRRPRAYGLGAANPLFQASELEAGGLGRTAEEEKRAMLTEQRT